MDVTLLGTGGPAGLPRPGCPCARCARALGVDARAPTAVLVDGALLLDVTPGVVLSAARAGRSVHGVRRVLSTRPQDDPARRAAPAPLPAPTRLAAGATLSPGGGHLVRAVAVDGPGTGYAVTGPDGRRLLYLPPGAAPLGGDDDGGARPADRPFDTVLLDVVGRPDALARLRETAAVGRSTDVVAVHLDHDVPPGPELHRRLAAAGARAVPDGTGLTAGGAPPAPGPPRRTLLLGGARSGKSAEAERRLATFPHVTYVATAVPDGVTDPEWQARIAAHRGRRPAGWTTVETCDLPPLLADDGPPLLVDCLTLWLTHAMAAAGCWETDRPDAPPAAERLAARVDALVAAVRATRRTVVLVSNEVGSGVVPATAAGRAFRDALGRLNAAVAAECEQVLHVVAGVASPLRG